MKALLARSVVRLCRIFRSVWTALHPNGWIVLVTVIFLVLTLAAMTCAYVQGSEDRNPEAKHRNDPAKFQMPGGFQEEAVKQLSDQSLDELKKRLLLMKAVICLLTMGVLVCLAAHKWSRRRPIRTILLILIVFQFFWFMVFTIQLTMNC